MQIAFYIAAGVALVATVMTITRLNATHALNTALFGLLRPGDRVVRTEYDHNAVRRPVLALKQRGVQAVVIEGDPHGGISMFEVQHALKGARLLVVTHANNVLGNVLPVADLAAMAHEAGALVLVDAAQAILPEIPQRLGDYAARELARRGVDSLGSSPPM